MPARGSESRSALNLMKRPWHILHVDMLACDFTFAAAHWTAEEDVGADC
jgi:hypothetical protein